MCGPQKIRKNSFGTSEIRKNYQDVIGILVGITDESVL